jgi:hypothetical protein
MTSSFTTRGCTPDDGWLDSAEKTWQESLEAVGSFRVDGDIESLKPFFRWTRTGRKP